MYFSLTFGDTKNTWTDWGLIPSSPPVVPPPSPNLNLVEIPGRIKGPIDLSMALTGRITYQRISGSWTFLKDDWRAQDRLDLYESLRGGLHGRETTVRLEEDSDHYFKGRFTVSQPQTGTGPMQIIIGYDLEPVRYNNNGTVDESWVSNWRT